MPCNLCSLHSFRHQTIFNLLDHKQQVNLQIQLCGKHPSGDCHGDPFAPLTMFQEKSCLNCRRYVPNMKGVYKLLSMQQQLDVQENLCGNGCAWGALDCVDITSSLVQCS